MNKFETNIINLTSLALKKLKMLVLSNKSKNGCFKRLRIYIIGGGCNGFQYKFILDRKIKDGDIRIKKDGVEVVIDYLSIQYLKGSLLDYVENLEKSGFVIKNPNIKSKCSCGFSFSIYD